MRVGILLLPLASGLLTGASDPRPRERVGSSLPLPPARTLSIEATSGTWLAFDQSADGRTLVFDLLGDLYRLPATGGRAVQISHGLAYDTSPVFSPDGRQIAFVSDRSGPDNIWVARADGSRPRQVTFGDDDSVLVQPAWSADGRALFVSRFRADLNNYELWRYPLAGGAALLVPIKPTPDAPRERWRSTLGAVASADGHWLYAARRVGGLDFDKVDAWTIVRRDLTTGTEQTVVQGSGARGAERESFFAPALSRDGTKLAYATRANGRTMLHVRYLATGEDRALATLDPDLLQASTWQGIVPRYVFTPDGGALIVPRGGRPWRMALDGTAHPLPFAASMRVAVGPSTRVSIREPKGEVVARLIQGATVSPDGRRLAFAAFGAIWTQPFAPGGRPQRLTEGEAASEPAWSPDGRLIAYVTWSETAGGQVWTASPDGSGTPMLVTTVPAFYSNPVFTPAGDSIVAIRSSAAARQMANFAFGKLRDAELVTIPLGGVRHGGAAHVIAQGRLGSRPQFTRTPGTVYILTGDGLAAIDLASGQHRLVAQVKGPGWYFQEGSAPADDLRISPDGRWLVALTPAQQLYLLPVPAEGGTIDLIGPDTPGRRLDTIGADAVEIGADGTITWSVGATVERLPLSLAQASGATPPEPDATIPVHVALPRAVPNGTLVLRGARVLTMARGDRVIDDADLIVTGDRITAIGPRGSVSMPPGATIREVAGKTILPGFVDEHDHIGEARRDVPAFVNWGLRARLAYGITTSFDPSTLSLDQLAMQDMVDAGLMLGPRLRSTGPALFSFNRFHSLSEVRAVLRRYRDAYGLSNIKEYRTGNRRVRQWVAIAARELGLQPTTEGALSMKLDLSQILDGFADNEHALAATPLGDDVIGLMVAQHTGYSTTLMITNSGFPASDWFAATHDPTVDPKLRRYWPSSAIAQKLGERSWHPLSDQRFPLIAADAARVAAAGGLVGMGAHGELPGIGFHYEMQAHAMGGMEPMAVLHAATAGSAEVIGRLADLGTVEPGKLADLVILDADPLADLGNTLGIVAVMRGGTLYDAATLAELWPHTGSAPAPAFASHPTDWWLPPADPLQKELIGG